MKRSEVVAWRAARLLHARGSPITLRRQTLSPATAGPDPQPNPAHVWQPTISGDHAAGTPLLTLTATTLVGRLVAGDTVHIAAIGDFMVTEEATAADRVITVTVSPPLPAPVTGGTAVEISWAADLALMAQVADGGSRLQDDSLTEVASKRVTIAAYDLGGTEPGEGWIVLLAGGERRTIMAINPVRVLKIRSPSRASSAAAPAMARMLGSRRARTESPKMLIHTCSRR